MKPTELFTKKQAGIAIIAVGLFCSDNAGMMLLLLGAGLVFLLENILITKFSGYSEKKIIVILCIIAFALLLILPHNQTISSEINHPESDHIKKTSSMEKDNETNNPQIEKNTVISLDKPKLNTNIAEQNKVEEKKSITSVPVKNGVVVKEDSAKVYKETDNEPKSAEIIPNIITSDNIKNSQMAGYIYYLRQQIVKKWNMASIYGNGYVVAEFTLDKEGNLITPKLVEGSKNQSLDYSVWNAIISIRNLTTPPAIYNSQKIRLKFEYNNGDFSIY